MSDNEKNNELTLNVTGWLYKLLEGGSVQINASQAEYVVQAKKWLSAVNSSSLLVVERQETNPDPSED